MTTTEAKHTPTPWNCRGGSGYSIQDQNGWEVAVVRNGSDDMMPNPSGANARHIVHCVNLHDDLAFVLQQILDAIPARRDWLDPDLEKVARAILGKAKERSPQ